MILLSKEDWGLFHVFASFKELTLKICIKL